ncbi:hypothetical protein ACSSS7_007162 [Eimeria intestinalis]
MGNTRLSEEPPLAADQEPDVGAPDGGHAFLEQTKAPSEQEGHGDLAIRSAVRRRRSRSRPFWVLAGVAVPSALALAFLIRIGLLSYPKKIPTVKDLTALHPLPFREEPKWKPPLVSSPDDEAHFTSALMKEAVGRVVRRLEAERPATPSYLANEVMAELAKALSGGESDDIEGMTFELTEMSDLGSGTITPGVRPFEVVGYACEDYDSVELIVQDVATRQRYAMVVRLLPSVESVPLSLHAPLEAYPLAEIMHCTQAALQVIGDTPLKAVGRAKGVVLPYVLGQIANQPRIIRGEQLNILNVVEFKELVRTDLQSVLEAAQMLPTGWKAHLARGVLKTVLHLQHSGLSHNKLSPSSFFVRGDGSVAVTAFEASTPFGERLTPEIAFVDLFTDPALLRELKESKGKEPPRADPKSDLWSLGMILYEILMDGERPFGLGDLDPEENPLPRVLQIPAEASTETLLEEMNENSINRRWQDLISRLLQPDRERRITPEQIVAEYQDLLTNTIETEVLESETFLELFQRDAELEEALQYGSMIASKPGSEPVPEEFARPEGTEQLPEGEHPAVPEGVGGLPLPSKASEQTLASAYSGHGLGPTAPGERISSDPVGTKQKAPTLLSPFEALLEPGRSPGRLSRVPESGPGGDFGTPGTAPGPGRAQPGGRFGSGSPFSRYTAGIGGDRQPAAANASGSQEQPSAAPESRPGGAASSDEGQESSPSSQAKSTQPGSPRREPLTSRFLMIHDAYAPRRNAPPSPAPAAPGSQAPSSQPSAESTEGIAAPSGGSLQGGLASTSGTQGKIEGAGPASQPQPDKPQDGGGKPPQPGPSQPSRPRSRYEGFSPSVRPSSFPSSPPPSQSTTPSFGSQPATVGTPTRTPFPSETPPEGGASSPAGAAGKGEGSQGVPSRQDSKSPVTETPRKSTPPLSPLYLLATQGPSFSVTRGPPSSRGSSPPSEPQPAAEGTPSTTASSSETPSRVGGSRSPPATGEKASDEGFRKGFQTSPLPSTRASPYYSLLASRHGGPTPTSPFSRGTQPVATGGTSEGSQGASQQDSRPREPGPQEPRPSRVSALYSLTASRPGAPQPPRPSPYVSLSIPRVPTAAPSGAPSSQGQPSSQSEPSTESSQGGASPGGESDADKSSS